MSKQVHVFIYGDVIGVGFRAWTLRIAQSKHLTGWVRNAEGVYPEHFIHSVRRVEAVFEGPEDKLKEMVVLCHKGPEVSWVEKVVEEWREGTGGFLDFSIKY